MPRVTIEDVAAQAGVSRTAVSFAFNFPDRLSAGTREKILRIAEALGYSPDPIARSMVSKRTGALGFLVPQPIPQIIQNPFYPELLEGVGEICDEAGFGLMITPPRNGSIVRAAADAVVDGFLTIGLETFRPAMRVLEQRGIPYTMIDSEPQPGIPCVNIDDQKGASSAMRHVLEAGHREIVILGMRSGKRGRYSEYVGTLKRRMTGYLQALREFGLDLSRQGTKLIECEVTVRGGREGFAQAWQSRRQPTAIVALADILALGVLEAATQLGLKVPDDLSIIGFDDIPTTRWTDPPLTTVHQPIREKGRLAADLLVQLLEGKEVPLTTVLPTQLVVRGSVASPRKGR